MFIILCINKHNKGIYIESLNFTTEKLFICLYKTPLKEKVTFPEYNSIILLSTVVSTGISVLFYFIKVWVKT